ncbi:ParB-like nuclease domain protein [Mycobacterium phage Pharaoh]|uniref:ParB-like nuclease domain protein n=1 Tax=Mycobacterium phage Pharaoh TaxID=2530140 RepID=A0A481W3G4_9CAUD|nr:ParB-like nuclease domain protein [Mycobacterium phage Pharaoh]QBJ00268.1 ParB-like nuclease domain protein [Mycobacterium phage Pharaoh]
MTDTLTLDEVSKLNSNDVACLLRTQCTIADSGQHLEGYYITNSREVRPGSGHSEYGRFWDKVGEIAEILKGSDEWPLPPLMVRGDTLYDGHHRANAAIKAGWDKPIPVTDMWTFW